MLSRKNKNRKKHIKYFINFGIEKKIINGASSPKPWPDFLNRKNRGKTIFSQARKFQQEMLVISYFWENTKLIRIGSFAWVSLVDGWTDLNSLQWNCVTYYWIFFHDIILWKNKKNFQKIQTFFKKVRNVRWKLQKKVFENLTSFFFGYN